MNVQDISTRVKRVFGDEAGVQVTDQDIIRWINDAQEEIVNSNEGLMETTGSADVIRDQDLYDLPVDISVLRSLKYNGLRLKSMSFQEFDEYLSGWNTQHVAGTPEVFMVWENKIRLFPKPDTDLVSGLSIYYIRRPTAVGNLADNLSVPLAYHNAVVNYCLQQAYEMDEDYQKAQAKKGQFDETMMKLNDRNKWTSQEFYPRITVLPEDGF